MNCCEWCGRDTTGFPYCKRCVGGFTQVSEAGLRPALPAPTERCPLDDKDHEMTAAEFYHGETWRDDL